MMAVETKLQESLSGMKENIEYNHRLQDEIRIKAQQKREAGEKEAMRKSEMGEESDPKGKCKIKIETNNKQEKVEVNESLPLIDLKSIINGKKYHPKTKNL